MTSDDDPKEFWNRRKSRIDEALESWRSATEFASIALKSAILLNGAAAIAVLTFIADKDFSNKHSLIEALSHFMVGAFSGVVATAAGFFSAWAENRAIWRWIGKGPGNTYRNWFQNVSLGAAILLVGYAYIRFWLGFDIGVDAILNITPTPPN